jgi:hypothetical protein
MGAMLYLARSRGPGRRPETNVAFAVLRYDSGRRGGLIFLTNVIYLTQPASAAVTLSPEQISNGGIHVVAFMSRNMFAGMRSESRLFGLDSGDWTMLLGGFALVALVVLLL